jgi:hypothetical protein
MAGSTIPKACSSASAQPLIFFDQQNAGRWNIIPGAVCCAELPIGNGCLRSPMVDF